MAFQQGDKVIILNPSKHAQETAQMTTSNTTPDPQIWTRSSGFVTSNPKVAQLSNRKRELEERLMTEQTEGLDTSDTLTEIADVEKEIKAFFDAINPGQWNV